jgi:hypothetical protein
MIMNLTKMKFFQISIFFGVSAIVAGVQAQQIQPSVVLDLTCKVTKCTDVDKPVNADTWCDSNVANYTPMNLAINGTKANLIPVKDIEDEAGVTLKGDDLEVNLYAGDQNYYYNFSNSALNDLAQNKVKSVAGTFTDGFDWTGGPYIRYILNLECSKLTKRE